MPQHNLLEIFHLKDIAGMVALSSDQIDYPLLEEWVRRYSLEKEWRKAESLVDM